MSALPPGHYATLGTFGLGTVNAGASKKIPHSPTQPHPIVVLHYMYDALV